MSDRLLPSREARGATVLASLEDEKPTAESLRDGRGINYRTGSFVEACAARRAGRGPLVVEFVGADLEGSIHSVAYAAA